MVDKITMAMEQNGVSWNWSIECLALEIDLKHENVCFSHVTVRLTTALNPSFLPLHAYYQKHASYWSWRLQRFARTAEATYFGENQGAHALCAQASFACSASRN